jgi:glycosyltransferase involved in cell wall biosynthesis
MKVLLVNDYKPIIGGTEIHVYELKKILEQRGHTVVFFSSDVTKEEYLIESSTKNVKQYLKNIFNIRSYNKSRKIVSYFKPDIIHLHNIFYELSPSFLLTLKKYPVIMTVHDSSLYSSVGIQEERTGKKCKNIICRGCTNCIGIKGTFYEIVKRNIHKYMLKNVSYYIGNSNYINNIIENLKIGKTIRIKYTAKLFNYSKITNNNNLLYVGRITKEKGIEYVILAMPLILQKFPNIKLTIVGNGEYKEHLQKLVKDSELENNIFFEESVAHDLVQKYYDNATIALVPSIWQEPFGMAGVEAMSVGRPVVASRVGGIPEWLEDGKTGYLVDPGNSEQIAEKVITLLSNKKLLQQMGTNARKKAEGYSLDTYVDSLERIYESLISEYDRH